MSKLQEMRETWRPKLAHDLRIQNWIYPPAAYVGAILQPEAGVVLASLLVAFYGLLAALYGIRQWGKNRGGESEVS
jgi:hypothetical protein